MLAQSVIEYAALATVTETLQRAKFSVQAWLGSMSTTDWTIVGAIVIAGLVIRNLRRSG